MDYWSFIVGLFRNCDPISWGLSLIILLSLPVDPDIEFIIMVKMIIPSAIPIKRFLKNEIC